MSEDATAVNRWLSIVRVPGKGRGVVARQAIPCGELLLAEEPLASPPFTTANVPIVAVHAVAKLLTQRAVAEPYLGELHVRAGTAATSAQQISLIAGLSDEAFTRVCAQVEVNAWSVAESSRTQRLVLYPTSSFFNHSCRPNVGFYGNHLFQRVYALQDIAAGTELCVAYFPLELYSPAPVRRTSLHERHDFVCHCARCDVGDADETFIAACACSTNGGASVGCQSAELRELFQRCETAFSGGAAEPAVTTARAFLGASAGHLDDGHWRVQHVRDNLVQALCAVGDDASMRSAAETHAAWLKTTQRVVPRLLPDLLPAYELAERLATAAPGTELEIPVELALLRSIVAKHSL